MDCPLLDLQMDHAGTTVISAAFDSRAIRSRPRTLTGGAHLFSRALMVWAWWKSPFSWAGYGSMSLASRCAGGWERFRFGSAIMHHELVFMVLAVTTAKPRRDAPNQTGFWTYIVL
jgi:hypothetical protein